METHLARCGRRGAAFVVAILLATLPGLVLGGPTVGAAGAGPALLQADAVDSGQVDLAWTPVPGATQYTVYRDGLAISSANTLRGSDTSISPGSSHSYWVTATVADVETSASPTRSVGVPAVADTQAPTMPGNLHTTAVTSTSATLAWSKATDDVGVIAYFLKVGSILYSFSEGSLTTNVNYLKANTTYTFDLTALDASGKQSDPAHVTLTTAALGSRDTKPPSAPSLTATPYSGSEVDLSWSKPGDADLTGFVVYQGSQLLEDIPPNSSVQTRVLPVTGLSAQTAYTFSVRSYDAAGNLSSATSKSVTTLAANDIRIARGPYVQRVDTSSARVIWRTNVAAPSNLSYSDGVTTTTVQDPALRTDHSVLIGPLPSLTRITYTLNYPTPQSGNFATCSSSPATLNLDAVGDMGGGATPEKDIANLVAADHPDLIAAMGDNVYPTGLDKDYPARLLTPYAAAFRGSPFVTTFGNHEYYSPGAADAHRAYSQPGNEAYFSFDCSGVHFAVLDAYQPYGSGSAQYQWLASDLAATGQPWKVVVMHIPPYSSSVSSTVGSAGGLIPLYEQYHVQLVLGGHSHNYERTNVINGVTYMVDGGGGNGLNSFSGTPPSWSAYRAAEYSYVRMKITPSQLSGTEVRQNGTIGDTFTLAGSGGGTAPDTVIDSGPPAQTNSTSAGFAFHATQTPATFQCALDGGTAAPCTSPTTYTGLAAGSHTFNVAATASGTTDPTPATSSWTIDTTAPTPPSGLTATAPTSAAVDLAWAAASDTNGIAGYDITRDGVPLASVSGTTTSYADTTVAAATTYQYEVVASDPAGNVSAPSNTASVTTPNSPPDDFSIGAAPSSVTVTAGQGGSSTISTAVTSGAAQSVTLSASGLPSGASASFGPATITAGQSSTLTITTTAATPAGTTAFSVTGTGTSATHSTPVSLTVNPITTSAPTLVQFTGATETATATSLTATFPAATTAGDLLVVSASVYTGVTNHITSVTDSAGNTWTRIGAFSVSGHNSDGEMWYSPSAASVTSVTVKNASAASAAFSVQEFSGVATSGPLDVSTGTSNTSNAAASGAVMPSVGNALVVGFVAGHANAQALSVTAPGFTTQPQQTSTGLVASVVTGYQVLPTPSSQSFTGSFASAMYWAAGIAVFKPGS